MAGFSSSFPNNGALEVVFSFDTTGSMYGILDQVRGRIQDMIQRLQSDIPGIRMAVFAHGDYCDASLYVTKWVDFTADVGKLCHFVQNVQRTGGGDTPECYELVLQQTRTKLSWTPGSRKALVLIGDSEPHEPDYPGNKDNIDWRQETKELAIGGVTIYGVQCGGCGSKDATTFYKSISMATGGKHLNLDNFGNVFDVLMAVCYREGNDTDMLASYEKEVRARCGSAGIGKDIDVIFTSLRGDAVEEASSTSSHSDDAPVVTRRPTTKETKAPYSSSSTYQGASTYPGPVKKARSTAGVRTRVSRPAKVSSPKCPKSLLRFQEKNLALLKRENVPETNFGLRDLSWSKWMMVLSPEKPEVDSSQMWVKRRGRHGYRLNNITPSTTISTNGQRRTLFEVSVQTPGSGKLRHVVYSSFSIRCLNNASWERCLLGVRHQMERVLQNGCRVYLRYSVVVKRSDEIQVKRDLRRYDYAWKKLRPVRNHARDVTKGSYSISMDESS